MKYYFSFDELTRTDTGICNSIPIAETNSVLHNLILLRNTLNVLRGLVGVPIEVTSAFRSREVNAAVGGSLISNHCLGRAADITCSKLHELLDLCMKLHDSGIFSEVIYYPDRNFIHVAI